MEETPIQPQPTLVKVSDASGTLPVLSEFPKQLEKRMLEIIPEATARKHRLFCFEKNDDVLRIAMIDPSDFDAMNMLRFLAEKESTQYRNLSDHMNRGFGEVMRNYSGTDKALQNAILSLKKGAESGIDLEAEKKKAVQGEIFQDAPIAKLVEVIVKHALDGKASDIHIEPIEGNYRVRFPYRWYSQVTIGVSARGGSGCGVAYQDIVEFEN
jgi:type IV pilus assembly protein PilB